MSSVENPPAFPRDHRHLGHNGMTLRDWFAGQALTGGMANADPNNFATPQQCASMAYQIADAMLAEREKAKPEKAMQHVAYYDEGQFHWMSGIAPRDCELFAAATGEV